MQRRRRNHNFDLGVAFLMYEIFQAGITSFPPVTLITVFIQIAIYTGFIYVPWEKEETCISAVTILKHREWKRFFMSVVEHADDIHLYYNMASFMIKGKTLERKYGSLNFGVLLFIITILTNVLYIFVAQTMTLVTGNTSHQTSCAIGFSGVIFALKVVTTTENPFEGNNILGIPMPGKYVAWVELILIHLLHQNASFMGHFAGILAGLLYCKTFIGLIIDNIIIRTTGIPMFHGDLSYEDYEL